MNETLQMKMMKETNSLSEDDPLFEVCRWAEREGDSFQVQGVSGAARAYGFSRILPCIQRPCLVVLPKEADADRFFRELQFFTGESDGESRLEARRLYRFPNFDMSPLNGLSPHRESVARRIESLYALISQEDAVVVTSAQAAAFKTMPETALFQSVEFLEMGDELARDGFLARLEMLGYQRNSLVEDRGDYGVRGSIIDLYPPLHPLPVRLEFWGDSIESIRYFDPFSQRSRKPLERVVLLPVSEIVLDEAAVQRSRAMGRLPGACENGGRFPGEEAWLNHFYPDPAPLFDYVPENGAIVSMDPHRFERVLRKVAEKALGDVTRRRREAAEERAPFPEIQGLRLGPKAFLQALADRRRLTFTSIPVDGAGEQSPSIHLKGPFDLDADLDIRLEGKGRVSLAPLAQKILEWRDAGRRIVLVCHSEQQGERLREILLNYGVEPAPGMHAWGGVPGTSGVFVCLGNLRRGFVWPELALVVVTEDEIFGAKRLQPRSRSREGVKGLDWSGFSQLQSGDLVVHEDHGVGRYQGMSRMEIAGKTNEFVMIEYADAARLYIPADRISILQKYMGADDALPRLDQLGGRSWDVTKKKAKKSIRRIARQLIELYALRNARKGHAFSLPDHAYREFEATFEHEETRDQSRAIQDVLDDMCSDRPMDRLICGDVGFGKTEVALRAAFHAVSEGRQVAVLVPTTVLAEQHYETFSARLSPYGIRVGILSRFRSRKEQSEIAARLRSGVLDVVIGTHRILQKDIGFANLGLLIVDEEQRFGVRQKEALKRFRAMVDVLALTATPVPRTLQMSMVGVRDLSIIETPPADRQSVETYVSAYEEAIVHRAIQFELERGGQVFFVHNRVNTIDSVAERLQRLVPEARFAVGHGQMREKELEQTMFRFLRREVDVLVCTAIIESGLDIPSANTIIIHEANKYGLAQIYQLRGRVGRSAEKAYAYLLFSEAEHLTKVAEKRLKALMDFSHLGAGLQLAMHDLKIRGGGNILGYSQSGHINAVGYELYLKLIEKAVSELKGETWQEDINPEINTDIPAFLPGDYVMDTDVRLNLYRRLSGMKHPFELEEMASEIADRFGPLPVEGQNLMELMGIRIVLKEKGIERLDVGKDRVVLHLCSDGRVAPDRLLEMIQRNPMRYRFGPPNKLTVRLPASNNGNGLSGVRKLIESLEIL